MTISTHMPRIITGVVLIAVLAAALSAGGAWLYGLAFVCSSLALWEFYAMFWPGATELGAKVVGVVLCAVLMGAAWMSPTLVPLALSLSMLALAVVFLVRFGTGNDTCRLNNSALVAAGLLYVPLGMALALPLSVPELVLLFVVAAATDTCAYFVGVAWGKHRVWPRVSPKKSVEGCLGGLAGCMVACTAFGLVWGTGHWTAYSGLGLLLALVAMAGDFFESALKRVQQVKDSGSLLPGHGGLLDRLDSFLFVAPAYVLTKALWPLF